MMRGIGGKKKTLKNKPMNTTTPLTLSLLIVVAVVIVAAFGFIFWILRAEKKLYKS